MSTASRHIFSSVATLAIVTSAMATDPIWINNGTITSATNVDATTVINSGLISIFTSRPFETANTLNYTNTGTMVGAVGFRFSHNPSGPGVDSPAANFNNRLGGSISAQAALYSITPNGLEAPNYLYVDSTNLLNQGVLSIEAGGEMVLNGVDIDLSRGGTGVDPVFGIGSVNYSPVDGQFTPDLAVDDNYWAQTNQNFNSANIIRQNGPLLIVSSPPHQVQTANGFGGQTSIVLLNPEVFAYTNLAGSRTITVTNMDGSTEDLLVATNITRQAVFVQPDTNYTVNVRFSPNNRPTNFFLTATVEVSLASTNFVTGSVGASTLYFVDTLASETNRGVLTNYVTTVTDPGLVTARPANYLVSRVPVFEFLFGAPGNTTISNTFLYNPETFTNEIVTGAYAGYSAQIDSLVSRPPLVPGGTVTNLSGRVKVVAEGSLDLNRARMQAAGLLTARTPHLITSAGAVVDAENLALDLGSTNGQLRVQNLINETVGRMNGDVYAWSGYWTNTANVIYTNYAVDTNGTAELDLLTNVVTVGLHTLILDAWGLIDLVPVAVHELALRSTNLVFDDQARVFDGFLIDAETFTLNGSITLLADLPDWTIATAPTLKHFTNHGRLSVPNEAHFGDDGPVPYLSYVNHGFIGANGQTVDADYCEITGTNQTTAALSLISRSGKIESAFLDSGGDLTLRGDVFRLRESLLVTDGRLHLDLSPTGSLADNGGGAGNEISCQVGFSLPVKPATGDLLGTTIHSISPLFALVSHTWAGEDRGATANGFKDNVALGILSLVPDSIFSDFEFQGVGGANGLYVDLLDLTLLQDYESRLFISPDLTIYFAASEGVEEEVLDGALGGRLRWVKDFAGPNSSVEVLLPDGTTIVVNRALRESIQIDSDGDGLANGNDPFPFDAPVIAQVTVNAAEPAHAQISWLAGAGVVYTVEWSSTGQPEDWHPLLNVTNTATSSSMKTAEDPDPIGGGIRFYRVSYKP